MSYIGTIRNTERTHIMYQNILCCHPLKQIAYPQSPSLCEPATVSDAKVVGGGGTDVTCCQVGTKICCARLDQACVSAEKKSSYTSSNVPLDAVISLHIHAFFLNSIAISPMLTTPLPVWWLQVWFVWAGWGVLEWPEAQKPPFWQSSLLV